MKHDGEEELHSLREAGACVFIARLLERPVDEHGPTNNIFIRDEAPITAVEADIAVVAHGENAVWRNYKFAILNVGRQGVAPFRRHPVIVGGWNGGEVVAI